MFEEEELMYGIELYGQWNTQEFVVRSQDMMDVLTYLRAERSLEMSKLISFATGDSVNFERRTSFPSPRDMRKKLTRGATNPGSAGLIDLNIY